MPSSSPFCRLTSLPFSTRSLLIKVPAVALYYFLVHQQRSFMNLESRSGAIVTMDRAKVFQHWNLQASLLLVGYAGVYSAGRLVRHREVASLLVSADEICSLAVDTGLLSFGVNVRLDFQKHFLSKVWLDRPGRDAAHCRQRSKRYARPGADRKTAMLSGTMSGTQMSCTLLEQLPQSCTMAP